MHRARTSRKLLLALSLGAWPLAAPAQPPADKKADDAKPAAATSAQAPSVGKAAPPAADSAKSAPTSS
jgi:hypothetical protein